MRFLALKRINCGLQTRYNNWTSPLTTIYENLWQKSMFYVSYMTLYDFQENFSISIENQNYTIFSIWNFLHDSCLISRKSYMVLLWLLRIHTNHIWPSMITKNHIWPSTKSKKVMWSLTRALKIFFTHLLHWAQILHFVSKFTANLNFFSNF